MALTLFIIYVIITSILSEQGQMLFFPSLDFSFTLERDNDIRRNIKFVLILLGVLML